MSRIEISLSSIRSAKTIIPSSTKNIRPMWNKRVGSNY